jgi:hypothetical protein
MNDSQTKRTNPLYTTILTMLLVIGGVLTYQAVREDPEPLATHVACQAIYSYPFGPYGPRVFVSPWHPPYKCIQV